MNGGGQVSLLRNIHSVQHTKECVVAEVRICCSALFAGGLTKADSLVKTSRSPKKTTLRYYERQLKDIIVC